MLAKVCTQHKKRAFSWLLGRSQASFFVHGIWTNVFAFSKLIPPLQAEGIEVLASQQRLDTLDDDIETARCTIARASRPVLLVGHSYGGALITHAGTDPRVAGLVYIAALSLDTGETSHGIHAKFPTAVSTRT